MKKNKVILLISTIVLLFSATMTITYAAFQNRQNEKFEIKDSYTYQKYFDATSGDGSSYQNAYKISTAQHLVNLEKLTQLGAFDNKCYFVLLNDINCENNIFLPIGTQNNPFYGQFDGQGYTIQNIKIASSNLQDVGFFGYVGTGGNIQNFTLDSPFIMSKGSVSKAENPLASSFTGTYTCSRTSNSVSVTGITAVENVEIQYISSDKSILSNEGVLQSGASSTFVTYSVVARQLRDIVVNDITSKAVVSYTIARFRIWIDENGIIPETYDETGVTITNCYNEMTTSPIDGKTALENVLPHTGIVAGHIDGDAQYIGVYNGKLWLKESKQESFNCLIGKYKNKEISNTAGKLFYKRLDFTTLIPRLSDTTLDESKLLSDGWVDDGNGNLVFNETTAVTSNNAPDEVGFLRKYYHYYGFKDNASIPTFNDAIGSDNLKNIRIFGKMGITKDRNDRNYYFQEGEEPNISRSYITNADSLNLTSPLVTDVIRFNGISPDDVNEVYYPCYQIQNGIMMWADGNNKSTLGNIIGNFTNNGSDQKTFYINFIVTYATNNVTSENLINQDIQFSIRQINYGINSNNIIGYRDAFYEEPKGTANNPEKGVLDSGTFNDGFNNTSLTINSNNLVQISDKIDYESKQYRRAFTQEVSYEVTQGFWDTIRDGNKYPLFAIGLDSYETTTNADGTKSYVLDENGNRIARNFPTDFEMNILQLEVILTSQKGNVNSTINHVDFIQELNSMFKNNHGLLNDTTYIDAISAYDDSGVQIGVIYNADRTETSIAEGIYIEITRGTTGMMRVTVNYYQADTYFTVSNAVAAIKADIGTLTAYPADPFV